MIKVFETRVTAIGSEAADMINAANMLILLVREHRQTWQTFAIRLTTSKCLGLSLLVVS